MLKVIKEGDATRSSLTIKVWSQIDIFDLYLIQKGGKTENW